MNSLTKALRDGDYAAYTAGNTASLIGNWMQRIAVGWLAWEMTRSGTWLGIIAFADMFPAVIHAPLGGAVADRWDRLRAMQASQVAAFVVAVLLALTALSGFLTIWLLLVFTLTLGSLFAVAMPLRMSIVSWLVTRENLGAAVAINSITFNVARFIGPAIAGTLIAYFGADVSLAVSAFAYLIFAVSMKFVTPHTAHKPSQKGVSLLRDMRDGFTYTIRHEGIFAVLLLMVAMGLGARPLVELLPGFAGGIFDSGPGGLAVLTSTIGLGAIIGGISLSLRSGQDRPVRTILANSTVLASSVLAFTVAPTIHVAVPIALVVGFSMVSSAIAIQTSIQLAAREDVLGRVLSVYSMVLRGGPAIGALIIGSFSELVGLSLAMAMGGCGLALVTIYTFARRESLSGSLATHGD